MSRAFWGQLELGITRSCFFNGGEGKNGERNKKGSLKDNDRYRIRVKQPSTCRVVGVGFF